MQNTAYIIFPFYISILVVNFCGVDISNPKNRKGE